MIGLSFPEVRNLKKRSQWFVLLAAVVCCGIMAFVDGMLRPGYALKSAIKIGVFLLVPAALSFFDRELTCLGLLKPRRKGLLAAIGLGVGIYVLILGAYFLIGPWFDFSSIAQSLTANAGVTKENFLFVSLYISFVNSFLEEFFFRGFVFTNLKTHGSRRWAHLFSAAVFALYHVAMMTGWFSPVLFILVMAGLTAGGVIFNVLNEKLDTIYASWLTHMFANFAINTIGFLLLNAG